MSRYTVLNDTNHQILQWYTENGIDECLVDEPQDRTARQTTQPALIATQSETDQNRPLPIPNGDNSPDITQFDIMGTSDAIIEAQKRASAADTLDALKESIKAFDGLSIKKTATNIAFADGNPKASVMVIGEAPAAEDDIQGKPFVGEHGQLFDKIFGSIGLSRHTDDATHALYLSNILNWRPPGNRTPTQAEIDIALPFIDKHISLIKPKVIVACGAVAAKGLLKQNASISKLRGHFYDYKTSDGYQTILMVTYHPTYLLNTPAQKRAAWSDMLMLKEKITTI